MPVSRISASWEAIANNQDLLSEILVRLPPKSLLCCKCVSNQWLSLISSPQFIATQVSRHGNPPPSGLLLNNNYLRTPEFQYVPLKPLNQTEPSGPPYLNYLGVPRIKVLQSCNGLLLCSSARLTNDPKFNVVDFNSDFDIDIPLDFTTQLLTNCDYGVIFFVCNPTTRQFKTISFQSNGDLRLNAVNLAFDPSHSPYFKVVCLLSELGSDFEDGDLEDFFFHVYDSQTNTWNPSLILFHPPKTIDFSTPVFCRLAIYWYSEEPTSLYFDVDKETFNPFPMPPFLDNENVRYFGESRGHLHLIVLTGIDSAVEFNVLELDEDYCAWSVKYHVNLDALSLAFNLHGIPSEQFFTSVLSIVRAEREEESELVLFVFGMVVSYNFKDKSVRKLISLVPCLEAAAKDLEYVWGNAFLFTETLSPI